MKILAVDHFFQQDLEMLQEYAPQHEVRVIPYRWLHDLARQVFPEPYFSDWPLYSQPAFALLSARWQDVVAPLLGAIRARYPFDVLVLPSDVIFYLRELIRWCQARGIPAVVVQKETSITEATMDEDSLNVRDHLPSIVDLMTINSERHQAYWARAGADTERVVVTGQPRFDYYQRHAAARPAGSAKRVLFLSYLANAYVPPSSTIESWTQLHTETLDVLAAFARDGVEVTVKPHPQQDARSLDEIRAVRAELEGLPESAFRLAHGDEDTRKLILEHDVVVGFQTTALYEALIAGKPVLYTNWTVPPDVEASLLDFAALDGGVETIGSPERLRAALSECLAREPGRALDPATRAACEFQLGPLDGRACERVWQVLETLDGIAPDPGASSLRRSLARKIDLVLTRAAMQLTRRSIPSLSARRRRLMCEWNLLGPLPRASASP